jgi:hypothetical protein
MKAAPRPIKKKEMNEKCVYVNDTCISHCFVIISRESELRSAWMTTEWHNATSCVSFTGR